MGGQKTPFPPGQLFWATIQNFLSPKQRPKVFPGNWPRFWAFPKQIYINPFLYFFPISIQAKALSRASQVFGSNFFPKGSRFGAFIFLFFPEHKGAPYFPNIQIFPKGVGPKGGLGLRQGGVPHFQFGGGAFSQGGGHSKGFWAFGGVVHILGAKVHSPGKPPPLKKINFPFPEATPYLTRGVQWGVKSSTFLWGQVVGERPPKLGTPQGNWATPKLGVGLGHFLGGSLLGGRVERKFFHAGASIKWCSNSFKALWVHIIFLGPQFKGVSPQQKGLGGVIILARPGFTKRGGSPRGCGPQGKGYKSFQRVFFKKRGLEGIKHLFQCLRGSYTSYIGAAY